MGRAGHGAATDAVARRMQRPLNLPKKMLRSGAGRSSGRTICAVSQSSGLRRSAARFDYKMVILPAAIGALLGAGCGIGDTGSIVIASVAPSCTSVR